MENETTLKSEDNIRRKKPKMAICYDFDKTLWSPNFKRYQRYCGIFGSGQ